MANFIYQFVHLPDNSKFLVLDSLGEYFEDGVDRLMPFSVRMGYTDQSGTGPRCEFDISGLRLLSPLAAHLTIRIEVNPAHGINWKRATSFPIPPRIWVMTGARWLELKDIRQHDALVRYSKWHTTAGTTETYGNVFFLDTLVNAPLGITAISLWFWGWQGSESDGVDNMTITTQLDGILSVDRLEVLDRFYPALFPFCGEEID